MQAALHPLPDEEDLAFIERNGTQRPPEVTIGSHDDRLAARLRIGVDEIDTVLTAGHDRRDDRRALSV